MVVGVVYLTYVIHLDDKSTGMFVLFSFHFLQDRVEHL